MPWSWSCQLLLKYLKGMGADPTTARGDFKRLAEVRFLDA